MQSKDYAGRRVLVTGGLGFIGGNLAIRLAQAGAAVTVVDSSVEGCGGNDRNLSPVRNSVAVIRSDIGDAAGFADVIRECDVIFNLAGEISHTRSMLQPERDLSLNTVAHLRFLEVCRRARPGVRIVYAGTRQVYGRPTYLPVDESHPIQAVDYNAIHKLAAAQYHLLLSNRGEIDAAVLRLTNVYGPRMALDSAGQGFIASFFRRALSGEPLPVYGGGSQLRDPLFVDDAVNAFLATGARGGLPSRVFNVGGPEALPLAAIARGIARGSGRSTVRHVPYPERWRNIEIGSYYGNSGRIRNELGWRPSVSFAEGVRRTFQFYEQEPQVCRSTPMESRANRTPASLAPAVAS
jgi:UDP-glucose 4-epimerase